MKITIKVGDQTHEVDHESGDVTFEDGLSVQSQADYDNAIKRAKDVAKRAAEKDAKAHLASLNSDDDFFRKIATARGIDLNDQNIPVAKDDPDRLKRQKQAWDNEFGAPKDERISDLEKQLVSGRRNGIERDLMAAGPAAGLKTSRMKTIFKGENPEFIRSAAKLMIWDDDRKQHYFKGDNGEPEYDGANYAGVDKLHLRLRKLDRDGEYYEDRRPDSSGFNESGTPGRTIVTADTMARGDADLEAIASGKTTVVN